MQATIAIFLLAIALPVSLSIKCQKCDSAQGDCNTGTCDGVWCVASVTENKATRSRTVHKDCASANPSGGKEDGCAKDTQPDGADNYRCGCNSGDNCNSEAGIARMQAMLNNQFSVPGAGAGAGGPFPGAPQPGAGGQPSSGQGPQVPPGLINPNSTFPEVISGQPTPFPGAIPNQPPQSGQPQPGQPQPGQSQPGQSQPGQLQPGAIPQPNGSNPAGGQQVPQFPPPNGGQQPFPQGGSNISPSSPNQNKPIGQRPGQETDNGFAPLPGGSPSNPNSVDTLSPGNSSESNRVPSDNRPAPPTNDLSGNPPSGQEAGRSRAGAVNDKNGPRTCACTEPSCNGPCKGEICYQMMFSANDVHSQAFAGKQGQIVQSGCTDDASVLTGNAHYAHRQIPDYKFKANGQEITVPASAMYCNDNDYCNGATTIAGRSVAIIASLSLVLAFMNRF